MIKLFGLFSVFCVVLSLVGCASLGELATDIQAIDATVEVAAVSSVTDDILNNPWDDIAAVGLGYVLALLRRWYKKKKGAA